MKTAGLGEVFEKLRARQGSDRKTVGIYLSQSVLERFKKVCQEMADEEPDEGRRRELTYSRVVEAWMELVIAESEKKKE